MCRFDVLSPSLLVIPALLLPFSSIHAGCVNYEDYIHPLGVYATPGFPKAIAYQEPHLYVAGQEGYLTIVDASDPASLTELSYLDLPARPRAMVVQGSTAYIALLSDELQLVDVSDPEAPTLLGAAAIPSGVNSVAVSGTYAYVPAWEYGVSNGLYIVDVSQPVSPFVVTVVDVGFYPTNIIVAGGFAYVLMSSGLSVLDLATPDLPEVVAQLPIPGDVKHLAARGGYLYVVGDSEEWPPDGNGLYIVNITDPTLPWIEGSYTAEDAPHSGIGLWEHYAIVGQSGSGLTFLDVSTPAVPEIVQRIGGQDFPYEIEVAGSTLFARSSFICTYALEEPFTPEIVATIPGTESCRRVAVHGDHGYAIQEQDNGFRVVNLSDPENPSLCASIELDLDRCFSIALTEDPIGPLCAYVGGQGAEDALQVVNIEDPFDPVLVALEPAPDGPLGLDVEGDRLYMAASNLRIYDISDPESPILIGGHDFTYSVHTVTAVGTTVYVGSRVHTHHELFIVDASDPGDLQIVGTSTAPESPYDIEIVGPLAYIADGEDGLLIMDVGDPENPKEVSRLRTSRRAHAIQVDGDIVYLADEPSHSGIHVVDVSDPGAPFVIGCFYTDRAGDVALINDHLLIATQDLPLQVAPLQCEPVYAPEVGVQSGKALPRVSLSRNPLVADAVMTVAIARAGNVQLTLHDVQGRLVCELHNGELANGDHGFRWDLQDSRGIPVASGVYFIRLTTDVSVVSKRLAVLR